MMRRRRCSTDCPACHYCDMPLATRHEHDHFPIPKESGGTHVVPACINCHDLKDRTPLAMWQTGVFLEGFVGVRDRLINNGGTGIPFVDHLGSMLAHWEDMTPLERIFLAKMLRMRSVDPDFRYLDQSPILDAALSLHTRPSWT